METSADCYRMADYCEQQATAARSDGARDAMLEAAVAWRTAADFLKTREKQQAAD